MAAKGPVLCCVLGIITAVLPACIHNDYMKQSICYLNSLGDRLPKDCENEAKRIRVKNERQELLDMKEDPISTMAHVSGLAMRLFSSSLHTIPANWDESKLNDLIHLQHRKYSDCVMTSKSSRAKIFAKAYFKKLRRFLKTKKYSRCAWETVRAEITTIFKYIE